MTKIAFLLMAHKDPARVIAQARALIAHGDCIAIHFDRRASATAFATIAAALANEPNVTFARRVKCGWGQFSLVRATLNLIASARAQFQGVTHYYLISGDCYPTKTRGFFDRFLAEDVDFIEACDFLNGNWIKTGMHEERLTYRHWWNEREHPRLFYASLGVQRRLGLGRALPEDMDIRIGSQWWVLRAQTIERLLRLLGRRRDLIRFFRTTWIPDETFFQTLVNHIVPADQIRSSPPTHLMFSDYGMPVVFHTDHFDYLRGQQTLFARKLSAHAEGLRSRLLETFVSGQSDHDEGGAGDQLYPYLANRGRHGKRYRPRFWETALAPREDRTVMVVVSNIWDLGNRAGDGAARLTGCRSLGYLFDEDTDPDLALGYLEHGLAKRGRHRQAMMNLIFETVPDTCLVLNVDPSRGDVIADIAAKVGQIRLLLIERPVSPDTLEDRARSRGLIGPNSGPFERREAVQAIAQEVRDQTEHLARTYKGRIFRNAPDRAAGENAADLVGFLTIDPDKAAPLVRDLDAR